MTTRGSLFLGAGLMAAFNDNVLITYLATLVPTLKEASKVAIVEGAVVGGELTVIGNPPNPAGQAILARYFGGAISPVGLLFAAAPATVISALIFRLLWRERLWTARWSTTPRGPAERWRPAPKCRSSLHWYDCGNACGRRNVSNC